MSDRRFAHTVALSLTLLCLLATSSAASNWGGAEMELTSKIRSITGPVAASLIIENRSSLVESDVKAITADLRSQFLGAGLRLVGTDQAAASVQVTLSENIQGYLWIAKVQQGTNAPLVAMIKLPRAGLAAAAREPAQMAIAKIQLWSQDNRILDVGVIDSPPRLIILEPERIVVYSRLSSGQWQQDQEFSISHVRPWPRDLRGRLVLRKDHLFDAYLPGVACAARSAGTLAVDCNQTDNPWPLADGRFALNAFFSPTRNFFTGVLTPGVGKQNAVTAFYSGAPIARDRYALWVFAAIDGQIHTLDGISDLAVSTSGWGSEVASVKSSCGTGWQLLATSNSDGSRPDTVRAYQFPDRDPVAVSEAVDLGGPVVALWTEQSVSTALAVSRSLRTGQYEAFRLAISCGE
jgi:hypothetical protein